MFSACLGFRLGARLLSKESTQMLKMTAAQQIRKCCALPNERTVVFLTAEDRYEVTGKVGESLLDLMHRHDLDLTCYNNTLFGFGICEARPEKGDCFCISCHVILTTEHYNRAMKVMPPNEGEEWCLQEFIQNRTDLSRLGCQLRIHESDPPEIKIIVPNMTYYYKKGMELPKRTWLSKKE